MVSEWHWHPKSPNGTKNRVCWGYATWLNGSEKKKKSQVIYAHNKTATTAT